MGDKQKVGFKAPSLKMTRKRGMDHKVRLRASVKDGKDGDEDGQVDV